MQLKNAALWQTRSFINGEWHSSKNTFKVENPANGQVIAEVSEVTAEQLELAVKSANESLSSWQAKTVDERGDILRRWYDLMLENQHDLAQILTAEQGKPFAEAMGEIVYGAKYIDWYLEEAKRAHGAVLPVNQKGKRMLVLKRPVGVVSAITPWNFPNAMILRKAAAALAAGCTFIVKPADLTPLSALAIGQLAIEAGIPAGVFNVVAGSDAQAIGEVLTQDPIINKFSFTGSTAVGKKLLAQCATTVKKTSMELGGNAPLIIFNDANMEVAIKGVMTSKYRNSGQTCVCANRIFVQKNILPEFVEKLTATIKELKVGVGTEEGVIVGPLIEKKAVEKVEYLVNSAIESGACLNLGGKRLNQSESGNFYAPTVLTDVTPDMDIFNNEIFGPVTSIISFETEEEVTKLANQTNYGLCSYIFTENLARIWRLSETLEYGMVGVNEGLLSNPAAPFGGVKESGMGREGGYWGLDDYLETKYICIGNMD